MNRGFGAFGGLDRPDMPQIQAKRDVNIYLYGIFPLRKTPFVLT